LLQLDGEIVFINLDALAISLKDIHQLIVFTDRHNFWFLLPAYKQDGFKKNDYKELFTNYLCRLSLHKCISLRVLDARPFIVHRASFATLKLVAVKPADSDEMSAWRSSIIQRTFYLFQERQFFRL